MFLLAVLTHIYAVFLCLAERNEVRDLRKDLVDLAGNDQNNIEDIEQIVFRTATYSLIKTPLLAIVPSTMVAIESSSNFLVLSCIILFSYTTLLTLRIRETWRPYKIDESTVLFRWVVSNVDILLFLKIEIVVASSIFSLLAQHGHTASNFISSLLS